MSSSGSGNSSGGGSSGGSNGGQQSSGGQCSGGYTKSDNFTWGQAKSSTYIDNKGYKRNTNDGSYTYEYPPRKYNSDGTVKHSG
ncbi:uncharacterized protein CTRU02_211651 [Colletotrichum truncatum]|uniref:Uncharacterized protein n=1 Tax=Colletotrichum truncatum TaxID=5467 RepID=A0ACC3YL98_COLTU|nr:uncharacterized protein CTRU02_14638 [Colletotrichum truncatum]KAF6781957.1 hypothetical protein CTRU02_14638 [Colletotrichum truncatum]